MMYFGHSADTAYTALVNVSSSMEPGFYRVAPFDRERSYLLAKIIGGHSQGTSMPPPGAPSLTPQEIEIIQLWIDYGALLDCREEDKQLPLDTPASPLLDKSGRNGVILGNSVIFLKADLNPDVLIFMGTALLVLRM